MLVTKTSWGNRRHLVTLAQMLTLIAVSGLFVQNTAALDKGALATALNANDRNVAHLLRDDTRHPVEVLEFVGIEPGMHVLDIYAADGYYSYILSKAVGASGRVYAQNPPAGSNVEDIRQMYSLADSLDELIGTANLENVTHLRESFQALPIPAASLDAIFLVQIFHDFYNADPAFAEALLRDLTTLLKPGGVVAMIDHAGDIGQDNSRLHRLVKTDAVSVGQRAGLILLGESDVLANGQDRRRRPVFDPMLGRNTDRFLLKFQTPLEN